MMLSNYQAMLRAEKKASVSNEIRAALRGVIPSVREDALIDMLAERYVDLEHVEPLVYLWDLQEDN